MKNSISEKLYWSMVYGWISGARDGVANIVLTEIRENQRKSYEENLWSISTKKNFTAMNTYIDQHDLLAEEF